MLSGEAAGGSARLIACGVSAAKRRENDLMYVATTCTCASERNGAPSGIAEPCIPDLMVRRRSSSVGTAPDSVLRNLYRPNVKSRGRTVNRLDAGPSPLLAAPWQF